jgi:sortase A
MKARSWPVPQWIERWLLLLGLLLVGVWFKDHQAAWAFQSVAANRLELATLRSPPSWTGQPASTTPEDTLGAGLWATLGRIEIPRLSIAAMIGEGIEPDVLDRAVGHVSSTARLGGPGNAALAGHRDTFFRGLGRIQDGDLVRIVTGEATYDYTVEWVAIVDPHQVDVLDSTATPSLTLVTCFPFHWVGPAPKRFIVRAVRAGSRDERGSVSTPGLTKQVVGVRL